MSGLITTWLVAGRRGFRLPPLDLVATPGQVIALIGPNGVGKTTLLKTLAGLLPPLAGQMTMAGHAAYLPPPGQVDAGFSALHLTALGRTRLRRWSGGLTDEDRQLAQAALERLGVALLADRPFDQLSSGQQQLVLIARMVVEDAAVCLLDEPLALLDPAHAVAVEAAIRGLAAEGRVVIASTHHLPFAGRADRVIVLEREAAAVLPVEEALSSDRLGRVFGSTATDCPCCGQALS